MSNSNIDIFKSAASELKDFLEELNTQDKSTLAHPNIQAQRCAIYLRLGEIDKAKALWSILCSNRSKPGHHSAQLLMRMMMRTNHHHWARDFILPYIRLKKVTLPLLVATAIVSNRLEDASLARQVACLTPVKFTSDLPSLHWLISNALRVGMHEKALEVAHSWYKTSPSPKRASFVLMCLDALGQPTEKVKFAIEHTNHYGKLSRLDLQSIRATLDNLREHSYSQPRRKAQKALNSRELKVALCLSGQMRGFDQAAEHIHQNIMDMFDTDVFISTWDKVGFKSSGFQFINRFLPDVFEDIFPYRYLMQQFPVRFPKTVEYLSRMEANPVTETAIRNKFPDAHISIFNEQEFEAKYFTDKAKALAPTSVHLNQLKMFFGVWSANEEKRRFEKIRGERYDLVIRLRPDYRMPPYKFEPLEFYDKCIVVDKIAQATYGDQLAISCSHNMDRYANIWPTACSIIEGTFDPNLFTEDTKIAAHDFITHYLRTTGLCITNKGYKPDNFIADFRPPVEEIATIMLADINEWDEINNEDQALISTLKGYVVT